MTTLEVSTFQVLAVKNVCLTVARTLERCRKDRMDLKKPSKTWSSQTLFAGQESMRRQTQPEEQPPPPLLTVTCFFPGMEAVS